MLFSFWSGEVSWMERLCVASAKDIGEEITVFTYGDREKLSAQLGCPVRDAALILSPADRDEVLQFGVAHFSDFFRLEAIARGCGTWTDLDVIFIKPLPRSEYVFGEQNDERIGNSVLRLPPDSELLNRYLAFCRKRPMHRLVMPWMPWTTKCSRIMKGLAASAMGARLPAPKYGPAALTYFAERCGVDHIALPAKVFYPIPIRGPAITRVFEPGFIESLVGPETVAVHLWRSTFVHFNGLGVPTSGWLAERVAHLLTLRDSEAAAERRYSV
ncbi:hypothetical protein [Hyphomicrobium facile]|uniref:Glycosyltransferase sugar-binding region containing DXD motif-containing protein n=1 Tax=Hyphomicrobium facile TaxID=51670 RepID=A0A1I7MY50_9HYPH|nr:hypothetical protein [Hyphomicrobium facile]SFV27353.1 hypothetical protein SAMN04488557_0740 [Hyphomicrobium facile]